MKVSNNKHVLYVEPRGAPSETPVWDELCDPEKTPEKEREKVPA